MSMTNKINTLTFANSPAHQKYILVYISIAKIKNTRKSYNGYRCAAIFLFNQKDKQGKQENKISLIFIGNIIWTIRKKNHPLFNRQILPL